MPVSEIVDGMTATGWTVSSGRTVEPFDVQVLGVLPDGVGPGRDMIVVEASSPAITRAGGIWYGMSGSPVHADDGRLLGVLAYGMSWGPSPIAGLTVAADVQEVMTYPSEGGTTAAQTVELSSRLAARASEASGDSRSRSSEMSLLKAPLSVSGVYSPGGTRMARINATLEREGVPLKAYQGASATASSTVAATPPTPGESFAAALSYGDITFAGIGTTSYVCDGKAVAFGHSFFGWPAGQVELGANAADTLTVVPDSIGGSYKLAKVAETVGVVDQDRYAGIRALFGAAPPTIPVTTTVTATDLGKTRDGQTDVVATEWLPYIAFVHALSNIDSTFDQIGEGSATVTFTINGLRESGEPFSLTRSNVYASRWDVSYESVEELDRALYSLAYNRYEDITFTGVDFDIEVSEDYNAYRVRGVKVSRNGGPWSGDRELRVRRGDKLAVKYELLPFVEGAALAFVDRFRVPMDAKRRGLLSVVGGSSRYYSDEEECFFDEGCGSTGASSFDTLLDKLQNRPTNDQVTSKLGFRGFSKSVTHPVGEYVNGAKRFYLYVRK